MENLDREVNPPLGECLRRREFHLSPSHPRILASSHPRILASSHPRMAEGKNPVHVKEALGHADLATTMGYTHLAKEHLRALVEHEPTREELKDFA